MKRILIVRSSAIGDVVFASALPAAIKRAYPDAHVTWLVEPGIHELLVTDPAIDEVITWSKAEWVKLWKNGQKLELARRVLACGVNSTPASSTWRWICKACSRAASSPGSRARNAASASARRKAASC